jgi:hypothetical protein
MGWVDRHTPEDELPQSIVREVFSLQKGDVHIFRSGDSFHIVQALDVCTRISPFLKRRRTSALRGQLSLSEDADVDECGTYSIETMGCQMNVADSERIAGQLEEMGFRPADNTSVAQVVRPRIRCLSDQYILVRVAHRE